MLLVLPFELRRDSLRRVAKDGMPSPAVAQEHKAFITLLSEGWWRRGRYLFTNNMLILQDNILTDTPPYPKKYH
jgi:hypothetical protein